MEQSENRTVFIVTDGIFIYMRILPLQAVQFDDNTIVVHFERIYNIQNGY